MNKTRLEAFSDGVIAIIITIMVLELKVPHGATFSALATAAARLPQLRAQLRQRRDLLEQPPPHAARVPAGERRRPLGQPPSPVLAVSDAVHHRMDGREPLRAASHRGVRRGAVHVGQRVPHPATLDHPRRRPRLSARARGRRRPEGARLVGAVSRRAACRLRPSVAGGRDLRVVALIWLIPDPRVERQLKSSA